MTDNTELSEVYKRFIVLLVKDIPCTCTQEAQCVATAVRYKLETAWPKAWKWGQDFG